MENNKPLIVQAQNLNEDNLTSMKVKYLASLLLERKYRNDRVLEIDKRVDRVESMNLQELNDVMNGCSRD